MLCALMSSTLVGTHKHVKLTLRRPPKLTNTMHKPSEAKASPAQATTPAVPAELSTASVTAYVDGLDVSFGLATASSVATVAMGKVPLANSLGWAPSVVSAHKLCRLSPCPAPIRTHQFLTVFKDNHSWLTAVMFMCVSHPLNQNSLESPCGFLPRGETTPSLHDIQVSRCDFGQRRGLHTPTIPVLLE
jgi:hypothetical protein